MDINDFMLILGYGMYVNGYSKKEIKDINSNNFSELYDETFGWVEKNWKEVSDNKEIFKEGLQVSGYGMFVKKLSKKDLDKMDYFEIYMLREEYNNFISQLGGEI